MKFKELKGKMKNKFVIKVIAGVLVVALAGTGVGVYAINSTDNVGIATTVEQTEISDEEKVASSSEEEVEVQDLLGSMSVSSGDVDKEETVYLICDANGNTTETIVEDHLYNTNGKDTLTDKSDLDNIENVKGDETFSQKSGSLTWQADGNDIYYRGNSSKEAPISQTVTYYLDGKEIKPEELAGQSGKVTIRFDYENNTSYTEKIDGKNITVSVPYAAVSAVVLDDNFSNIAVTNGKIKENNGKNIVVGYALPGLAESLDIDEDKLSDDRNIPDFLEITADVDDFSLSTAMTVVVNATDFVSGDTGSLDSLDSSIDNLESASSQLQDGSSQLADGADKLLSGVTEYTDGVAKVADGISTLSDNIPSLTDGVTKLNTGIDAIYSNFGTKDNSNTIRGGAAALASGSKQVSDGVTTLENGANNLATGASQLSSTLNSSVSSINTLSSNSASLIGAFNLLKAGNTTMGIPATNSDNYDAVVSGLVGYNASYAILQDSTVKSLYLGFLSTGADDATAFITGYLAGVSSVSDIASATQQIADGAAALSAGVSQVSAGAKQVSEGASSLSTGVEELYSQAIVPVNDGMDTLVSSMPTLTDGVNQLKTGSSTLKSKNAELVDGVKQLSDGATSLSNGMVEFDEKGINKLVNAYSGDIKPIVNRLQVVKDAGKESQIYSDISDDMTGSVKFVYKLGSIK